MTEFIVTIVIGCAVGLSAFIGLRYVNKKWRGANASGSVVITIIAIFIGLLVSRVTVGYFWPTDGLDGSTRAAANQVVKDIRDAKPTDEKTATQVARDTLKARAAETLAKAGDDLKERQQVAKNTFMGFYLANVRIRPPYCEQLGVPIPAYVQAFKQTHQPYLDAITRMGGIQDAENRVYDATMPKLAEALPIAMQRMAEENKVTQHRLCEVFQQKAQEIVNAGFLFSNVLPEQSAILLSVQ
jgi:hypothetical protein